MSRDDFDKWIEQNYSILMATAGKKVGYGNAEDAVQGALLRILETKNYERCETNPLSWFMQSVKSVASHTRRAEKGTRTALGKLGREQAAVRGQAYGTPPTAPATNPDDPEEADGESVDPPTGPPREASPWREGA